MKIFDNTKTHQIYEMRMSDNTKLCQIYEMQMLGNMANMATQWGK